jgi:SAM-dependent methyltransferase
MSKAYVRLLVLAFLGSGLAPLVSIVASESFTRYQNGGKLSLAYNPVLVVVAVVVVVVTLVAYVLLRRLEPNLEQNAGETATFLDTFPLSYADVAIFGSAALSLFLELAIIRWQATVFEFFAFYKNFSLLACFAGLGLGYALSGQKRIPLVLTIPILCWEFTLMIAMRYGMTRTQFASLRVLPFREQLNMGLSVAPKFYYASQTYFVIAVVFLLTALAFLPIGQLCGALMQRLEKLRSYGLNLLGSLAGVLVLLMFFISAFWTPPSVWFLIASAGLLLFFVRRRRTLLFGAGSATVALIILAWPVNPLWQRIYSPYQLIEIGYAERGLMVIRAGGNYFQRVIDLSYANRNVENDPALKNARNYYELPYQIYGHPRNVAIVGAGTGNDVAAALRSGTERVDAIEIDPVIQQAGSNAHPEHPYSDPRVHAIINDARSFLRTTNNTYDMIVFGLLDSHALLSQASSVRLDSFVYTVQALREARARLKPHGVLSLSFDVFNNSLGRKIYLMMTEAFDGHAPICV